MGNTLADLAHTAVLNKHCAKQSSTAILGPIMRRVLVLSLLFTLSFQPALAGVNNQMAKVVGGTTKSPPAGAMGFIYADPDRLNFEYYSGKNKDVGKYADGTFSVPYANVGRVTYGDVNHLRVGQTIALAALAGVGGLLLLLSKSHTHYLTIDYKDEKGQDQMVGFEVGKTAIQPIIHSIELRTGKKVEFEAAPGTPSQNTH
ncbi:MAG TPA: hypothetical protein VII58_01670 [Acidobacteriaceae bacterium]